MIYSIPNEYLYIREREEKYGENMKKIKKLNLFLLEV